MRKQAVAFILVLCIVCLTGCDVFSSSPDLSVPCGRLENAFMPTPEAAPSVPESCRNDPEPVLPDPESARNDPEFAQFTPGPVQNDPEPVLPDPESARNDPEPSLFASGLVRNDPEPTPPNPKPAPSTTDPEPAIVYEPYVFDKAKAIPASRLLAYYNLDDVEIMLYKELLAGVLNLEPVIYLEIPMNARDDTDNKMFVKVRSVLAAVHPEIFWLSLKWSWGNLTDGTPYVRPCYMIDGKSFGADVDGRSFVLPTDNEMDAAKAWIKRQQSKVERVLEGLPIHCGMTLFELEVAVHDWLCINVTYDYDAPNKDLLYGALIEKKAACEGYSKAFQYIMGLMGVECLMVYGTYYSDYHGWSAAKFGGQWYQVDVTADATTTNRADMPCHEYLNRSDEYMSFDHVWRGTGIRVNAPIVCTGG